MQLNEVSIDLPPKYYPAIGELIFRTAQLEYQMCEIIWRAIKIGIKEGRTLTIGMDNKVLRGILGTLANTNYWVKDKAVIQEINSIRNNARNFSKLRNKIAHGSWQYPQNGNKADVRLLFQKEQDEKILAKFDPKLDNAYIHNEANKLRAINVRAQKLISKLVAMQRP